MFSTRVKADIVCALAGMFAVLLIVLALQIRARFKESDRQEVAAVPKVNPTSPVPAPSTHPPPSSSNPQAIPVPSPSTVNFPGQNGVPAPPTTYHGPSGRALPPLGPVPRVGSVTLGNAKINVSNDGHGHEMIVGRVLIVNDTQSAITDFSLSVRVGGLDYVLAPFQGSLRFPSPANRYIPPGGTLDTPVMTTGTYTSYSVYGPKSIHLRATLDGPPGVAEDDASVL